MEPKVVDKEIVLRLKLVPDGSRTMGVIDGGQAYWPATWLLRHVLSLSRELGFDYDSVREAARLISELLQKTPVMLPVKDFLNSLGAEDQWRLRELISTKLTIDELIGPDWDPRKAERSPGPGEE